MANIYQDGFEWIPTAIGSGSVPSTEMVKGGWYLNLVSAQYFFVSNGRFGYGKSMQVSASSIYGWVSNYIKTFPDQGTPAEGFIGMAMRRDSVSDVLGWHGFAFYDALADAAQISIIFGRNGVIKVVNGSPGSNTQFNSITALASSKAGSFDENTWFHVEARVLISGTVGTIEVRINTVPVIQLTATNTKTTTHTYFDSVALIAGSGATSAGTVGYWDDLFVNDTSGTTNNTWTGNARVKTQFMTANGATDNFLLGGSAPASTNWQSVLNQALDDTKYVYSATINDIDFYAPDPIINAPLVRAVQLRSGLRQDDATQRQSKHALRIGATTYLATPTFFTTQTYSQYFSRWDLSPSTGVSFTAAEVNGFQTGLKLTA